MSHSPLGITIHHQECKGVHRHNGLLSQEEGSLVVVHGWLCDVWFCGSQISKDWPNLGTTLPLHKL